MRTGPDTGEFMAISVTMEEPKIAAAQLAERVSALSEALEDTAKRLHYYHIANQLSRSADWKQCHLVSCRKARYALTCDFA